MKQENQRLNKLREGVQRKLRDAENSKAEIEQQKETLKTQMLSMERGNISINIYNYCYINLFLRESLIFRIFFTLDIGFRNCLIEKPWMGLRG